MPALAVLLLAVAVAGRHRVPRIVRAALAATAIQLALAAAAWLAWQSSGNQWSDKVELPLERVIPWAVVAALTILAAALVLQSFRPRRKTPRWLAPLSIFSIANLLIAGLWLPLFASMWPESIPLLWGGYASNNTKALLIVAGAPAVIAALVAVRGGSLAKSALPITVAVVTAILAGIAVRGDAGEIAQGVYGEFVPLLITYVFVSLGAITSLAVCQLRELAYHRRDASRPAPWVQRGIIIGGGADQPPGTWVGVLECGGWLGGFSARVEAFQVRSEAGTVVSIPRRSMLSLPLPASCCDAAAGEIVATLSVGDPVAVAGFIEASPDGAFRQNAAPIPSSDGVIVYGPGAHRTLEGLAYVLWRPCVLFLIATTSIAIPGLVGLPF